MAEPEVVFRIIHVALANGSPAAVVRDLAVEVELGPNVVFPIGKVGTLTRQVPAAQVVNAVPPPRRTARPPTPCKPVGQPRIVETLHKAIE